MKAILMSNSVNLHKELENYFDEVKIVTAFEEIEDTDVLIISDSEVDYNTLIENYDLHLQHSKYIFYILSKVYENIDNIVSICKAKRINIIPPKLTLKQIVRNITNIVFPSVNVSNKIVTFYGADNKVGTTMIAQSIAENFSKNTDVKVGLLFLNGSKSTYYIKSNILVTLDDIKVKLLNRILSNNELINSCIKKNNLYILPGANQLLDIRHYHPEDVEYLINLAHEIFDIVFIEAGSNIDSALAIASLNSTKHKYLITTQKENTRINFERIQNQIFKPLRINNSDFMLIVNNYIKSNSIYSAKQIADLYNMTLAGYVPYLELLGWQAEFDNKTLLHYGNEEYNYHINEICKLIATQLNINYKNEVVKKKGFLKAISLFGGSL